MLEKEAYLNLVRSQASPHGHGLALFIRVKPRSTKEGLHMNEAKELVISVNAWARDDAANVRAIELLSEIIAIPKSKIEIVSGHRSRVKRLLLHVSSI